MLLRTRTSFACVVLLCAVSSRFVTPLDARAAAEDDSSKPLALGEIAYTGGAFTYDGRHFVYAVLPKGNSQASELRAADTTSGKVESLGLVPLRQQQPGTAAMFRWSMGVLAADNDLATVYVAQYGPNEDLAARSAVAWGVKQQAVLQVKQFPDLEALQKERAAAPRNVRLTLNDLDLDAVKQRKAYQPIESIPQLVGKKELTIEAAPDSKEAAPARQGIRVDVTAAFREMYAAAVGDYPNCRLPMDSGKVLVSDSIEPVAQCGNWLVVRCGFYAHYGIHGRGYDRLILTSVGAPRLILYPGVGSHSASGVRTGPLETAFLRSPDGKSVVGISNGRLTLYRLPRE